MSVNADCSFQIHFLAAFYLFFVVSTLVIIDTILFKPTFKRLSTF
ncbi:MULTISPECIES: hypothetical protein [Niallia]|nr:hypothetical protein [Niallia circulans]MED3837323.1 hypothetical protein [Niallia circulans]MED4244394.1 hypothetical protein [Niallia circulans]MED4248873.1 hypothetical protein [Niallia circulans]MED5102735.1 hypothetical protein [Niallia circulans]